MTSGPGSQLRPATAPSAPGRIGTAIDASAARVYLDELHRW